MIDRSYLFWLRTLGIVEGISTLVLFGVAMPLKYIYDQPMAVSIAGMVHGILFVGLVLAYIIGIDRVPLSRKLAVGGILGAIPPFGPFVTEIWLARLARSASAAPEDQS